jgi:hypothetical protein
MRVAGRRRVGERDAVVIVDRAAEGVQRRYFFDAQTGLLLRIVTLTDAILNQIPEQIDFEDYREVEGIKLPFLIRFSNIVGDRITAISGRDVSQLSLPIAQKLLESGTVGVGIRVQLSLERGGAPVTATLTSVKW